MPNLRDRSKLVPKPNFEVKDSNSSSVKKKPRWSIDDKKRMLLFIKRYGVEMILSDTVKFFPNKTSEEIQIYLEEVKKKKYPNYYSDNYISTKTKNPFEIWQEILEDLSSNIKDHSNIIALAVNKIISNEKMDESKSGEDPNWQFIYKYLSAALSHRLLPHLQGIDASVVLKLIVDLMSYLGNLNVEQQRALLAEKHALLVSSQQQNELCDKLSLINKALLLGNPKEDNWKLESVDSLILGVQKEPLYFLNPLNIPIKLLRPQQITTNS